MLQVTPMDVSAGSLLQVTPMVSRPVLSMARTEGRMENQPQVLLEFARRILSHQSTP